MRTLIDYYVANNSTVYVCSLDLTKAFDKVDHSALFRKLMDKKVPGSIVKLLRDWLSKSFIRVKWEGCLSIRVQLFSGVRQGGILSPFFFACLVDDALVKLSLSTLGCRLKGMLFNAIMYADDLLLLSLSVTDLQLMVNLCASEFACIGLSINVKKSACISIGVRHKLSPFKIRTDNADIDWKQEISFLGLTITASNTFKCNLQKIRHKFYRALSGLFGKIGLNSPTSVTLSLVNVNTFCLPILM